VLYGCHWVYGTPHHCHSMKCMQEGSHRRDRSKATRSGIVTGPPQEGWCSDRALTRGGACLGRGWASGGARACPLAARALRHSPQLPHDRIRNGSQLRGRAQQAVVARYDLLSRERERMAVVSDQRLCYTPTFHSCSFHLQSPPVQFACDSTSPSHVTPRPDVTLISPWYDPVVALS